MDLELAGKTFLITGGTDGLGLALAEQLATEGAAVGVCGRDEERLRAAERAIRAAGGDVLAQRADVSRPGDLEAFAEAAVSRWGRIDGVVHNAGRSSGGSIETIDDDTWESDFQLKLMAAVRLTRLVLPQLRASRGAVLFTLAIVGQGARSFQRAELGDAGRRHGAHEGALQGARTRRHPGQRNPHRAHRERPVGPAGRTLRYRAAGVLRPLRPGRRHTAGSCGPGRRVRRPRLFPAFGAGLVSHRRPRSTSTGVSRLRSEGHLL